MYRKMLVPVDGSRLSEVVLEYARELSGKMGLDLTLLHVCDAEESELAPLHRAYILQAAQMVSPETGLTRARGELAFGQPAGEILRYVREQGIDLILMATHGSLAAGFWPMGSVAREVVSNSDVPVWLIPSAIAGEIVYDLWPTRKILVPLDGSKTAECVLPHVETIVRQRGPLYVNIVLLRVSEEPERYEEDDTAEYEETARDYLSHLAARMSEAGLKVECEVLSGKPAGEIIKYAQSNPFNLIVMSSHGRSGLSPWPYGNVADRVLHGVSSPILLVRTGPPIETEPLWPFTAEESYEHV